MIIIVVASKTDDIYTIQSGNIWNLEIWINSVDNKPTQK